MCDLVLNIIFFAFVWVKALYQSQQFFSHVGMFSYLIINNNERIGLNE